MWTNRQIPWTSLSIMSHQPSKTTWPSSSNSSVTPAGCSHGNKDNISEVNEPIKELLNSTGHSKQIHAVCYVPGHKTLWKYRGYVEIFPQVLQDCGCSDLLKDVPRTIYGLGLQVVEPSAPYFGSHVYYPMPPYHYHLPVISTTTSSLLYASALWVPLPASTRIWVPTNSAATEQN